MPKTWGEEALEPQAKSRQLKQGLITCLLLFLLFSMLPYFDYHRFLPPLPESVEMACHMARLEPLPDRIVEAELLVGHIGMGSLKLFLYATVLRRHIDCRFKQNQKREREYLYSATYINISGVDIALLLRETEEKYHDTYSMWNYDEVLPNTFRNYTFDEHGLSAIPIDPYEDFLVVYLILKFFLLLSTIILTTALFLVKGLLLRQTPQEQPYWRDIV